MVPNTCSPSTGRGSHEDHVVKASLGYIVRLLSQNETRSGVRKDREKEKKNKIEGLW